jgi:intracellular multiplication protein IcmB
MSLPPRNPRPFSELFRVLAKNNPKDPLRLTINLSPDGFDGMGFKGTLARILSFTSADNRSLASALAHLKDLADSGETIVGLSMAFDTYLDPFDPSYVSDNPETVLRARLSRLARQVSGWGQGEVQEVTGDPLLGVCATLPAMMPHGGPAPRAAAPLSSAWSFLPVRPASPWRHGPLVLRTPDGKIMPFSPNSSAQSAWIDIGLAPMGGGKSLLLNTINLAFCLQAGLGQLPWVSIIDVGPSSKGLISLLKASLPNQLKHLAVHHRLRLDPNEAINPFDTPLGVREPLPSHLTFLVNLISLMATPLTQSGPPSGVDGVLRQAIVAAYRTLSDRPRPVDPHQDRELCDLALSLGFAFDSSSSWWEMVDFFHFKGLSHQAFLAQRYAVPLLSDVAAQVKQHPGLKKTYNFNVQDTSQPILDYVWRELTEALGRYRFLSAPTRLSFGDARVIALDLDEVAPRGGGAVGDRQTAVMYMLARQLCGGRFFLTPSDLPDIPEPYRPYHEALIKEIGKTPKRLCYDELHRVTGQSAVRNQLVRDLETTARESRKWNLSIGLYSQSFEDFPPVLLELATSVFLLGSGTKRGREELSALFGLHASMQAALERLGKPTAAGAVLAALFRTAQGTTQQLLTNTVPPALLWAFSTTSEDISVRDALYASYGVERTLSTLSRYYPSGLKAEVERRKAARRLSDRHERVRDVTDELVAELSELIERR